MAQDASEKYHTVIATPEGLRSKFVIAYRHAECLMKNGDNVELMVQPALEQISAKQRKFLKDVVFAQIAEQVQLPVYDTQGRDTGRRERFDKAAWAELFRKRFLGHRYEMQRLPGSKKAAPVKVRNSTEALGIKAYAEYTDKVINHATVELKVIFHFEVDERPYVRSAGKQRTGDQS